MTSTKLVRLKKMAKGVQVVELGVIAPVLFAVLFAVIEMGFLFWANLTMQYAVREGARYSVTGQTNLDPTSSQQRYLAVLQEIRGKSMGLFDQLQTEIVTCRVNSGSVVACNTSTAGNNPFGSPGEIIVVRLDCKWKTVVLGRLFMATPFFPNNTYSFSVAATLRNEAF